MIKLTTLLRETVEFTKNGNLWIDDIRNIPDSKWVQINRIMNNKGYDMRGADDCKRAVLKFLANPNNGEENTINPEIYGAWVDTIASVMNVKPLVAPKGTEYDCKRVIRAAIRAFGKTNNIREAGYILPSGTLLSLTNNPNHRDLDHREINSVYSRLGIEIPPDRTKSNSNIMMAFMKDCRAIRCGGSQPAIDMYAEPTRQQGARIVEHLNAHGGECMLVCRSDKMGWKDINYPKGTNPSVVLRDIVSFYKYGKFASEEA
jgi:hypothetical protein